MRDARSALQLNVKHRATWGTRSLLRTRVGLSTIQRALFVKRRVAICASLVSSFDRADHGPFFMENRPQVPSTASAWEGEICRRLTGAASSLDEFRKRQGLAVPDDAHFHSLEWQLDIHFLLSVTQTAEKENFLEAVQLTGHGSARAPGCTHSWPVTCPSRSALLTKSIYTRGFQVECALVEQSRTQ